MNDAEEVHPMATREQSAPQDGARLLVGVELPTAYLVNAERALTKYPEQAANYLRHTLIGDPLLDGMPQELADIPRSEVYRFVQAGMNQDLDVMRACAEGAARLLRR